MYSVLCQDIHHHQIVFIACLAVPPWIAHRLVYFALLRFASLAIYSTNGLITQKKMPNSIQSNLNQTTTDHDQNHTPNPSLSGWLDIAN
jgi:hypothetical protein